MFYVVSVIVSKEPEAGYLTFYEGSLNQRPPKFDTAAAKEMNGKKIREVLRTENPRVYYSYTVHSLSSRANAFSHEPGFGDSRQLLHRQNTGNFFKIEFV